MSLPPTSSLFYPCKEERYLVQVNAALDAASTRLARASKRDGCSVRFTIYHAQPNSHFPIPAGRPWSIVIVN